MRIASIPCISLVLFACALPAGHFAQAQQAAAESGRVLVIQREFTKPGKEGAAHEATEAAFIRAMKAGNGNAHYIAVNSLSGENRTLFLNEYDSFAAWETEHKNMSPELGAALDKANQADGDMLSSAGSSVWLRSDDLSTNVSNAPTGTRVLEVSQIVLKPGHMQEWKQLAKMYVDGAKNIPELHWTTYELAYGKFDAPAYLILTALKSGAEVDAEYAVGQKKFEEALGEDGLKKMSALEADCVATEMTNLFVINPRMSIPPDNVAQAEPEFWSTKPAVTAATHKAPAKSRTVASAQ